MLRTIIFPDVLDILSIGEAAFSQISEYSSRELVIFPSTVRTLSIGSQAFYYQSDCHFFTDLTFPRHLENIHIANGAFAQSLVIYGVVKDLESFRRDLRTLLRAPLRVIFPYTTFPANTHIDHTAFAVDYLYYREDENSSDVLTLTREPFYPTLHWFGAESATLSNSGYTLHHI
jgi:hypothetical protein